MSENKRITVVDGYWVPSQSEKPENQRCTFDEKSLDIVCNQKPGYEMALEILKEDALETVPLENSNLEVLLSEKTRPYPPKSPLDLMLLVAAETPDRVAHNITDLKTSELTQVLKIAEVTLQGLEKTHTRSSTSPLIHRVIAYNYHEDPLPEEKTGNLRKTYTQTLPLLHLHTFVLSENDVVPTEKGTELSQKERDIARDPLFSTIHILAQIPSIREFFAEKNITLVRGKDLQFQTKNGLSSKETAESLVHIHETFKKLYQQIVELFVDFHQNDSVDMPLFDQENIFSNINIFIQKLRKHSANKDSRMTQIRINAIARHFIRFAKIFHEASPETIQEGKRLFLRSPAYTLLASPTEGKEWNLLLSPKIISTGNALHSLGYYKKSASTHDIPPEEWWDTREKMVHTVRKKVRELK